MEECKHEFIGHESFVECTKCGARLTPEEYKKLKNKVQVPPIGKKDKKEAKNVQRKKSN